MYKFTDQYAELRDVYYRLSSVDYDGKETQLGIKKVKGNIHDSYGTLLLYPNPTSGDLSLEFIQVTNEEAIIEIYSLSGEKVMSIDPNAEAGLNKYNLNTDQLNQGNYVIKIISGEHMILNKFTKK